MATTKNNFRRGLSHTLYMGVTNMKHTYTKEEAQILAHNMIANMLELPHAHCIYIQCVIPEQFPTQYFHKRFYHHTLGECIYYTNQTNIDDYLDKCAHQTDCTVTFQRKRNKHITLITKGYMFSDHCQDKHSYLCEVGGLWYDNEAMLHNGWVITKLETQAYHEFFVETFHYITK
jgi:hypothetical protein